MKKRIMVVDDEPAYSELASKILSLHQYAVSVENDPVKALQKIKADTPDLVLLDVMMPQMNGLDVCSALKADPKTKHIPIIFVSVQADEADVVAGLEMGAEDYVKKPLRERELIARVRAAFRRQEPEEKTQELKCGPFRINFATYKVFMNEQELDFTPKQFELFAFLAKNEGKVLTRATISEAVWGADMSRLSRTMDATIDQIRRKIGGYRDSIEALRGVGYRFDIQ